MYYFGVWDKSKELGHYLYDKNGRRYHESNIPERFPPLRYHTLDGGLLPRSCGPNGKGTIAFIGGWQIIQFWDTSGDSRPASNSSFIVETDNLYLKEVLISVKKVFPHIFNRFDFEITIK